MENTIRVVDFHTHILPGVDDGARNMEVSLEIINRGVRDGIETFVLTPHIRDASDLARLPHMRDLFAQLRDRCLREKIPAELVLGAEVLIFPSLPEHAGEDVHFSLGGPEKYILIELPFLQMPLYTDHVLHSLMVKDFTPVLAHPERYRYLHGKLDLIESWVDRGLKLQVNTGSLNGRYGWRIKWFAKKLVRKKLAHYFGSDAHNASDYAPSFCKTMDRASRTLGNLSRRRA
jgi:protein-tyrosine phosphatase